MNGTASITVRELVSRRKIDVSGDRPILKLHVRIRSSLNEMSTEVVRSIIVSNVKKQIEQEILATYRAGVKKDVDLYNFEETLYRRHLKTWKRLAKNDWQPGENDLRVSVELGLKYSGVFELK